jgi:amino acid adenylation domain-containing protein
MNGDRTPPETMRPGDPEDAYPLAPLQRVMLVQSLAQRNCGAYIQQKTCAMRERVDAALLEQAWRRVVDRHAILRTSFRLDGGNEPMQLVHRHATLPWSASDWSALTPEERQRRLDAHLAADRRRDFDLGGAPLVRVALFRFGEQHWLQLFTYHHALLDGRSERTVLREVFDLYDALATGRDAELPPPPRPYRQYVARLAQQDAAAARAHWQQALAGFSAPTSLAGLLPQPGEVPSPERYGAQEVRLSPEATHTLARFAGEQGVTLNTLVVGAWGELLGRYSGETDIAFGVTVGLRGSGPDAFADSVGLFINTVPLRLQVDAEMPLRQWLQAVRARWRAMRPHAWASLADIRKWSGAGHASALFSSLVVFEHASVGATLREQRPHWTTREFVFHAAPAHPLTLVAFGAPVLWLRLVYERALFDSAAVAAMVEHLRILLEGMVAEADLPLRERTLLAETERRRLLVEWNATDRTFASLDCVHRLFERQARRTPDALAVEGAERRLSYRALDERANRLAHALRRAGVAAGTFVGVCTERVSELVVAILGVLKAGGAYLPLDPANPPERTARVAADAGLATMVVTPGSRARIGAFDGRVLVIDEHGDETAGESVEPPAAAVGLDGVAYAVYTSGSTGEPKGIAVGHRALANHTLSLVERYGIGAADRRLQFVSIGSDVLIAEIFPVLAAGGTLVLRPDEGMLAIADFLRFVDARRITIAGLPSAYWHEWVATMSAAPLPLPPALRLVVSGMDSVRPDRFAAWKRIARGRLRWFNAYGPSEATCTAASYEADLASEATPAVVPIGRPLPNLRIYLLDSLLRPVPIGLPGEIHIAGQGVAIGYLHRPRLTAEKFVRDPFSADPASRLYRTGDLGRYLPDGNIAFLGRLDDQVKIRGYRVEPHEVEQALEALPAVRDACVVVRGEAGGARRLVAFVVLAAGEDGSPAGLRAALRRSLPEYLVPAEIVLLAALPLTPSGKIDLQALPEPAGGGAEVLPGSAGPRNALEARLAALWTARLPGPVGIHDRFLDAGGDSLTGIQLLIAVQAEFGVEIAPDALFDDAATIAGMAARIEAEGSRGTASGALPTIPRRAGDAPIPLSGTQAGAWFLHRLDPTGVAYNEPRLWEIEGEVDIDALRAALADVAIRQPMLRTRFVAQDGHPRQVIDPSPAIELEIVDLASLPAAHEARLAAAVRERTNRRFDLAAATPSRWTLLRLGAQRSALLRVSHHILGDALSARILHRELTQAYAARRAGQDPALAPLPVDYADYSLWQATAPAAARLERELAFWKARLAGLPVLGLPADFLRPAAQSFRGATVAATIAGDAASAFEDIGRGHGATPFATWLAAFSALLSRLSGETDLAIGTPVAARGLPELAPIVGFFANTVVFRADLSGAPTTHALLARTRDTLAEILAHQQAPLERVVEALGVARDPSRNPLFQIAFALWDPGSDDLALAGTRCSRIDPGIERAKFDLTVSVIERTDAIDVRWEYCTDLFQRATIERMSRQFALLVAAMTAHPEQPVTALPLMDAATAERVLRQACGAANAYPAAATIAERFAEQVRARPAAPAVGALDYASLDAAANRMARELRRRGAGPGTVVAVARRATPDIAIAWLAVLKAGAAYLPIDPDLPAERVGLMIAHARAALAVADGALETALCRPGVAVLCPERDAPALERHSPEALDAGSGAEDPAYVMYTSGSTGTPKGVVIPQRAVLRLVCATDCAQIVPEDTVAQLANPAFDASTFEIWGALLNGARLAGIAKTTAIAPRALAEAIASQGVTALFLTTALFNAVAREAPEAFRACRCVLFGGEAVEPRWVASVLRAGPPRHLLHVYGPTETTTFATWHEVRDVAANAATIPIGRPLANTEAFVLRDDGELAAPGEPGEIWIGGPGVASGYCNAAPDAVAGFVERAVGPLPPRRLYRTGDRARVGDDGAIEFLGRRDRQIKLRGQRIELEEIEAAVARLPQVRAAVVALQGETTDTRQVVAWAVAADPAGPPPADLRRDLRRVLPDYMLPASVVWMKALPLNASGKVDRHALPAVATTASAAPGPRVAPRDMLEQVLCGIWERALGASDIGVLDHFFEIGGHSLLAARLFDQIERETGVAVPLAALFADDTIAGLARALRQSPAELTAPVIALNAEGARPPLAFLHGDLSGGGFYSRALARALGPGQPVLVVQPHGLDSAAIPETIEAMAAERIAALRALRPRGPYLLGGYCNGAFVAFEMARQLAARGEAVPLVVVIEAVAPRASAASGATPGERYVTIDRGGVRVLAARDRASEAQLRYSQAMDRYPGGSYDGRFVLVRTREGNDPRRDLGWTRLVRRLELVVLPGDHVTLVTRHVGALADAIRGAIERTLAPSTPRESAHER